MFEICEVELFWSLDLVHSISCRANNNHRPIEEKLLYDQRTKEGYISFQYGVFQTEYQESLDWIQ
jgi:hypothetical protein